jgi:hypothetical protein
MSDRQCRRRLPFRLHTYFGTPGHAGTRVLFSFEEIFRVVECALIVGRDRHGLCLCVLDARLIWCNRMAVFRVSRGVRCCLSTTRRPARRSGPVAVSSYSVLGKCGGWSEASRNGSRERGRKLAEVQQNSPDRCRVAGVDDLTELVWVDFGRRISRRTPTGGARSHSSRLSLEVPSELLLLRSST